MNCPNCGKDVKENQKFCIYCGAEINKQENSTNKNIIITTISIIIIVVLAFTGFSMFSRHNDNSHIENAEVEEVQAKTPAEILNLIDTYQIKYFAIVKRNDMLLQIQEYEGMEQDRQDLKNLYDEVKNQIRSDNMYLQKYNEIEQQYAENTGETTVDMNNFEDNHYKAVDKLLNDVYQEVKAIIPQEDFKQLTKSELKWIKNVDKYNNVYKAQGFGTIGGVVYLGYQIDMRNFRTLLLMLYLK